ncbi:hypothetical protein Psch_02326 [Pelotomaculum schinkii]|uniref:Uncharacterized protein n=1 Tax=Pelotomaculum schinkii TaxID=78350 RepID=A0A4Y7R8I7_9FIRM|nr:hypothetical protein [Pelotomaculum schinkii]TEB05285.1 hypothetical protein Psch_02326 [Pelotomaculum schinkii]
MGGKDLKHYCFGQISWRSRQDIAPNTAEFILLGAYRRDAYSGSGKDGLPVRGDIILDTTGGTSLVFGDGTLMFILKYIVTAFSEKENWILGRALDPVTERKTILHTYPAPADPETEGPWKAGIKSTHRQALKEHVNNPGRGYQIETLVEFTTSNGSPAAFVPVFVNAPQNSVFSFPVAVAAPDGDSLTCRLATDVEASGNAGGFTQPGPPLVPKPLTVETDTYVVTWRTTGTKPGQLWSYQVMAEDGKSKAGVEALIRIIPKAGEPPVCAATDQTQSAPIGMLFNIDIVASDPDGLVTAIEAINLPFWARLNITTELPAADAVASISGIPGPEDVGLHVLSIVATDNDGNQAVSPLKIKVDDGGFNAVHQHDYYKMSDKAMEIRA